MGDNCLIVFSILIIKILERYPKKWAARGCYFFNANGAGSMKFDSLRFIFFIASDKVLNERKMHMVSLMF